MENDGELRSWRQVEGRKLMTQIQFGRLNRSRRGNPEKFVGEETETFGK
jgi:hypothetical protein